MALRQLRESKGYYVEKIKADLKFVIDHTAGKTKEGIEANELLIDSIMFYHSIFCFRPLNTV